MWISGNVMKLGFLPLFLNDLFGWRGWSNGSGVDKDTNIRRSQCRQVWPLTQLPSVSARCKKPMWMKRKISSCASKISNLVFRASRCDSVLSLPWIQAADTQVSILGDKVIYRPVRRFKILMWIWECLKHEWPPNKEMANLVETCLTQSISTHAQPTHSIRTHAHVHTSHYQSPQTTHSNLTCTWLHLEISNHTADGKKPAPVDMANITSSHHLKGFIMLYTSQLLQDFFPQQYIGHIGAPWHALGTPAAACSAMRTSSFALPKTTAWDSALKPSDANHLPSQLFAQSTIRGLTLGAPESTDRTSWFHHSSAVIQSLDRSRSVVKSPFTK